MFVGAVHSIFDEPSLVTSWKIFLQALSIDTDKGGASFNLPIGTFIPNLWLANEQIAIEIESYNTAQRGAGKSIRYQEVANQTDTLILCIKGLPQPNRYSVRIFVPKGKTRIYPRFYWATFAEGEGQKLCLVEGHRYWYLQHYESPDPTLQETPKRDSELILKALAQANSKLELKLNPGLGNACYLMGL